MVDARAAVQEKLTQLIATIESGEATLRQNASGQERALLLEVIRAIDSIGYIRNFAPGYPISDLPGYLDISWIGANRALSLFLPAGMLGPGAVWGRTHASRSQWASGLLYRSGLITHLTRLVDFVRYGLATVELTPTGAIRFEIIESDLEAIDRQAIVWFIRHVQRSYRPILNQLSPKRNVWLKGELEGRVERDPIFDIRYSSSRELEGFFEAQAEIKAQSLPGNDSLPDNSKLGPLTFGQYRTAIITGMARCLKHSAFVDVLLARPSPPASRDIMTIYAFDNELVEQWGGLLSLSRPDALVMLEMMGMSTADISHMRSVPDCPQALLIRGGDQCWHTPVFGGLNNPFSWVTRKLQRAFRQDWDRAVNSREAAFRDDLRMLFPEPRFLMPEKPHLLRREGRTLTDIDALILDRQTGTFAVFQLKWQDSFENSLAERASRQKNVTTEGNAWVDLICRSCEGLSSSGRALLLGVKSDEAANAREMRLFVLARNGAKFSGGESRDTRAAWVSWYDLLRRCHMARNAADPLSRLWRSGRRERLPVAFKGVQGFELDGFKVEYVMAG
jgi:hypothetical protein